VVELTPFDEQSNINTKVIEEGNVLDDLEYRVQKSNPSNSTDSTRGMGKFPMIRGRGRYSVIWCEVFGVK